MDWRLKNSRRGREGLRLAHHPSRSPPVPSVPVPSCPNSLAPQRNSVRVDSARVKPTGAHRSEAMLTEDRRGQGHLARRGPQLLVGVLAPAVRVPVRVDAAGVECSPADTSEGDPPDDRKRRGSVALSAQGASTELAVVVSTPAVRLSAHRDPATMIGAHSQRHEFRHTGH